MSYMRMTIDGGKMFDLLDKGDFFAHSVECKEDNRYVYYRGTYRNWEGQEFFDVTLEVLLNEPVRVNDGKITIPSTWQNFWVLGHELP